MISACPNDLRKHLVRLQVIEIVIQNSAAYDSGYGEKHKLCRNNLSGVKALKGSVQVLDLNDGCEN